MYGKSETCDMHIWQANKMFSYIMHEKEIWKNKLSVHTSQPILSIAIKKTIETEEFCMLFERTILLIYIYDSYV